MSEAGNYQAQASMPPAIGGLVIYLYVDGAVAAADFYKKAFGAVYRYRIPPGEDGRTMHIHLLINGASLMLSDYYPEHGMTKQRPAGFNIHQQVEDADQMWQRAIDAGATSILDPHDAFWGDRYAQVQDPWGVAWAFGASKN